MEKRFAFIEERFEQVDRRFEQAELRFIHLEDLIDTIAMTTNVLLTKVDELLSSRDNHETRIERLERSVARLNIKYARH